MGWNVVQLQNPGPQRDYRGCEASWIFILWVCELMQASIVATTSVDILWSSKEVGIQNP